MEKKYKEIIKELNKFSNPNALKGMAYFGIRSKDKLMGLSIPQMTKIAKEAGRNHQLAQKLWKSGIHEGKILAAMIDEIDKITERQMESWVKDFDSWDVCDQVCSRLFDKTPYAYKKAFAWSKRKEEFVKRAGFVLMATLSVHDKEASDAKLMKFFPAIKRGSTDERNFVKKAVNWAIRQIGKRNKNLNKEAIKLSKEIQKIDSKAARWITADALRELKSEAVQRRLHQKK
jgi:3-methyladenine DNA glycosylase AlkD